MMSRPIINLDMNSPPLNRLGWGRIDGVDMMLFYRTWLLKSISPVEKYFQLLLKYDEKNDKN